MQNLIQCFLDADMRCQHDGLAKIAKRKDLDVYSLKKGEHVVFINSALDRIKMFSSGAVLSYLRLKKGKVNLETLRLIPEAFNDGNLEVAYSRALKQVLETKLKK